MARKLQSPGVEINEINVDQRAIVTGNTAVFVTGFASQGPTNEIVQLTGGTKEFEQVFGLPTNPAERYFYHTVKQITDKTNADIMVSRLPYGEGSGEGYNASGYSCLAYPMVAVKRSDPETLLASYSALPAANETDDIVYFIGKPKFVELSEQEYNGLLAGEITWSDTPSAIIAGAADLGKAGFIVLNKAQTTLNSKFEGYYIGISDNANVNPETDYDSISTVYSRISNDDNTLITVPAARLGFSLTANAQSGVRNSISEIVENAATFDLYSNENKDMVNIVVFRLTRDLNASDPNILTYSVVERITGSFDAYRQASNPLGGNTVSAFIENVAAKSKDIAVLVNPNIANAKGAWQDLNRIPTRSVRVVNGSSKVNSYLFNEFNAVGADDAAKAAVIEGIYTEARTAIGDAGALFPVSVYSDVVTTDKNLGSIPNKVERALRPLVDTEVYNVDLILEAGLGTIWVGAKDQTVGTNYRFDDTVALSADAYNLLTLPSNYTSETPVVRDNYMAVASQFINLIEGHRKDCMFIPDVLRQTLVRGKDFKTLADKTKYFSKHIYWAVRHQFEAINSNYVIPHTILAKVYDTISDSNVWIPGSGIVGALCANTPNQWDAPAGFDNGVISGVIDLAYTANQKENDQLYNININSARFYPADGFVMFGQKTKVGKPNVLDRVNTRRTLLFLEKATARTVKYFVFHNNTYFTRAQIVNVLTPIFANVKNAVNPGIYDFKIVCNESNNTPDIIDDNTIIIDIGVKLARTGEYVVVNMITTRTSQNFSEVLAG